MKATYTLIIAILFYVNVQSQNYQLFATNSLRTFTDNFSSRYYGVMFDTVINTLIGTRYLNYSILGDTATINDSLCYYWGGPIGVKQTGTTWLGKEVMNSGSGLWSFRNNFGGQLNFDFGIPPHDSTFFYIDPQIKVYIKCDTIVLDSIANQLDSLKIFSIHTIDQANQPLFTPLVGEKIVISKNFGLLEFIRVDSFPAIMEHVRILGDKNMGIGFYEFTNENLYNYQGGDEIQYFEINSYTMPPLPTYFYKYITHRILSRNETIDSLIYNIEESWFYKDSTQIYIDTIELAYLKKEIIVPFPMDKPLYQFELYRPQIQNDDWCGQKRWKINLNNEHLIFCEEDTIWTSYDTQGPPPMIRHEYLEGVGLYYSINSPFGYPYTPNYLYMKQVVYFKKNGVECGTQQFAGIAQVENAKLEFEIFPNPASEYLNIRTGSIENLNIDIFDLAGNLVLKKSITPQTTQINISSLQTGIYMLKLSSKSKIGYQRFVKAK